MIFTPLHAILDVDVAQRAGWSARDLGRAFLDAGAPVVQVRGKQLPSGALLTLCDHIVNAASSRGATIVVNDRADLARLCGASAVHVGQDDLAPAAARDIVGSRLAIGYSTHSIDQVRAALREPVDYIAVGPIFGTHTKDTGYTAVGVDLVAAAARLADRTPIVAIGGITLQNVRSVIDAGASAVAVISDLLVGNDPRGRIEAYLGALA